MFMKVSSVSVSHYGLRPEGSFIVTNGDTTINQKLSEDDAHRIQALIIEIFNRDQQLIAKKISDMSVPLLGAPPQEAEFTEVDPNDDTPF